MILGLDPSPTKIGWALLCAETGLPVDAGTMLITVEHEGWAFVQARNGFHELAAKARLLRRDVTYCAVEDPMGPSKQQAKWNGEVLAYCKAGVYDHWGDVPLRLFTPPEWKKAAGGGGGASKPQVAGMAQELCGEAHWPQEHIDTLDQDACDAIVIARALFMELERDAAA